MISSSPLPLPRALLSSSAIGLCILNGTAAHALVDAASSWVEVYIWYLTLAFVSYVLMGKRASLFSFTDCSGYAAWYLLGNVDFIALVKLIPVLYHVTFDFFHVTICRSQIFIINHMLCGIWLMALRDHRTPWYHLVVRYSTKCELGAHRSYPLHPTAFSTNDWSHWLRYLLIHSWYIKSDWFRLTFYLRVYYALSSSVTWESAHVVSVLLVNFVCFSCWMDANFLFFSTFGLLWLAWWDFHVIFH